jgi:hypothetical protein
MISLHMDLMPSRVRLVMDEAPLCSQADPKFSGTCVPVIPRNDRYVAAMRQLLFFSLPTELSEGAE